MWWSCDVRILELSVTWHHSPDHSFYKKGLLWACGNPPSNIHLPLTKYACLVVIYPNPSFLHAGECLPAPFLSYPIVYKNTHVYSTFFLKQCRSVEFEKFGHNVACGHSTGSIDILDIAVGCQKYIPAHKGSISSLAYTSCGRFLVSGSSEKKKRLSTHGLVSWASPSLQKREGLANALTSTCPCVTSLNMMFITNKYMCSLCAQIAFCTQLYHNYCLM